MEAQGVYHTFWINSYLNWYNQTRIMITHSATPPHDYYVDGKGVEWKAIAMFKEDTPSKCGNEQFLIEEFARDDLTSFEEEIELLNWEGTKARISKCVVAPFAASYYAAEFVGRPFSFRGDEQYDTLIYRSILAGRTEFPDSHTANGRLITEEFPTYNFH